MNTQLLIIIQSTTVKSNIEKSILLYSHNAIRTRREICAVTEPDKKMPPRYLKSGTHRVTAQKIHM